MLWVILLILEIEKYDIGNAYALLSNVVLVLYSLRSVYSIILNSHRCRLSDKKFEQVLLFKFNNQL